MQGVSSEYQSLGRNLILPEDLVVSIVTGIGNHSTPGTILVCNNIQFIVYFIGYGGMMTCTLNVLYRILYGKQRGPHGDYRFSIVQFSPLGKTVLEAVVKYNDDFNPNILHSLKAILIRVRDLLQSIYIFSARNYRESKSYDKIFDQKTLNFIIIYDRSSLRRENAQSISSPRSIRILLQQKQLHFSTKNGKDLR